MNTQIGINGLKRVRTKNGRTYYYLNGKRVSSQVASDFQRKDSAKRSARAKKSAEELLYYKGRALPKAESFLLKQQFQKALKDQKENRLDKLKTKDGKRLIKSKAQFDRVLEQLYKQDYSDIFKDAVNQRGKFKSGYEGGVVKEGVKDVAFWLKESAFNRFKVICYVSGGQITGKTRVLNYLAEIEIQIMEYITEAIPDAGILAQFFYNFELGMNMRTIYINMAQNVSDVREYVIKNVRAKEDTLKPYADLTIKIGFS
jgi:hypothetical protein